MRICFSFGNSNFEIRSGAIDLTKISNFLHNVSVNSTNTNLNFRQVARIFRGDKVRSDCLLIAAIAANIFIALLVIIILTLA